MWAAEGGRTVTGGAMELIVSVFPTSPGIYHVVSYGVYLYLRIASCILYTLLELS